MRSVFRQNADRRFARQAMQLVAAGMMLLPTMLLLPASAHGDSLDARTKKAVEGGLDWLAATQSRLGHWAANGGSHPAAMTALAGNALLCEGSTTTQGKYAENIRRAVDYLLSRAQPNGLLAVPADEGRYTYGHGFAMLFLSQVLGEEEDEIRRNEIYEALSKAVIFSGQAQTNSGGWGYVSARDGAGFDEGSTTITQVQGLRGCRDAGVPVPKEIIDKAIEYIRKCTGPDGGVVYRLGNTGGRPAITAAAIACLFNAGEYDDKYVPKMLKYCDQTLGQGGGVGHWHYTHYYYTQVKYRQKGSEWETYREKIFNKILGEAVSMNVGGKPAMAWTQGAVGPVFVTSINLTILQLEKGCLPIYQR